MLCNSFWWKSNESVNSKTDVTVWIFGTSDKVTPHLETVTQKASILHRTPGEMDRFLIICQLKIVYQDNKTDSAAQVSQELDGKAWLISIASSGGKNPVRQHIEKKT